MGSSLLGFVFVVMRVHLLLVSHVASGRSGASARILGQRLDSSPQASTNAAVLALVQALGQTDSSGKARTADFEAELSPMFAASPRMENGRLGREAARDVLRHFFHRRYGWSVDGLAVLDVPLSSSPEPSIPEDVRAKAVEYVGVHGFGLLELAVLAGALLDLVHAEVSTKLSQACEQLNISTARPLQPHEADVVVKQYLMDALSPRLPDYTGFEQWAVETRQNNAYSDQRQNDPDAGGQTTFAALAREVMQLGERLSGLQEVQCRASEGSPVDADDRPRCMRVSRFYSVCCATECERLLLHFERGVSGIVASPPRLAKVATLLMSDSSAQREFSTSLLRNLEEVAVEHGGQVRLRSLAFAKWMHHAFPHKCASPASTLESLRDHEAGAGKTAALLIPCRYWVSSFFFALAVVSGAVAVRKHVALAYASAGGNTGKRKVA